MVQPNLNRRLSAQDVSFLDFERDEAPMHIGSVAVFEGEVPLQRFLANIESKLHLIPRYLQRVVPAPFGIALPTWEFDPEFDIKNHVQPVRIDPPGSDAQLSELAARLFAPRLSREKPLWEMYLVHGLEHGRSAAVSRVHHCLVDGVSGIELLMVMLDVSPNPPPPPPPSEPYAPGPIPGPATRLFDALWDGLTEAVRLGATLQMQLLEGAENMAQARSVMRALEASAPYFSVPVRRAPFNGPFSGERKVAWSDYSFAEVRAIRAACGGTVNDVVLAVLGGALGRYLQMHGEETEERGMRVLMPVNVRREDERGALGNRISMVLVEVPVGLRDPIERLRTINERTEQLKRAHAAEGIEILGQMLGNAALPLRPLLSALPPPPNTLANMVCTNVPGPMIPLYSVGHRMVAHYPMVPIAWQMGIGCGVTSYDQRLYFGLMADARAAPDVDRLKDFLDQSYVELRAGAGVAASDLPQMASRGAAGQRPRRRAAASSQALAADAG